MNKEKIQLRRLGESDVVTGFDCGDSDLNDFIMTDAPLYFRVRLANAGCCFITVDAYADALPFYFKQGFAPLSKEDEKAETRLLYFDLETLKS